MRIVSRTVSSGELMIAELMIVGLLFLSHLGRPPFKGSTLSYVSHSCGGSPCSCKVGQRYLHGFNRIGISGRTRR
jgi:hypothetical protein